MRLAKPRVGDAEVLRDPVQRRVRHQPAEVCLGPVRGADVPAEERDAIWSHRCVSGAAPSERDAVMGPSKERFASAERSPATTAMLSRRSKATGKFVWSLHEESTNVRG